MNNIIITLFSSLLSGIIGVLISNKYHKKANKNNLKAQVFRNVIGFRYHISNEYSGNNTEFFTALNEIFVVFNDNEEVIVALTKLHSELNIPQNFDDNLVNLIKRMADVIGINYSSINDSFIQKPFTPSNI